MKSMLVFNFQICLLVPTSSRSPERLLVQKDCGIQSRLKLPSPLSSLIIIMAPKERRKTLVSKVVMAKEKDFWRFPLIPMLPVGY